MRSILLKEENYEREERERLIHFFTFNACLIFVNYCLWKKKTGKLKEIFVRV